MSEKEQKSIVVRVKKHSDVQVDPAAFKHELTQIYLELKNVFTPEYVAQNAPLPEIDEEILQPKTAWNPPKIELQLPESVDVSFCDVKNCNFDNKLDEISVQSQKIYNPNTQKPSLEFSRDYKIKKEKISIANTDWQKIKPEKIEKCDFTLVVPSVKKINQEYKIEISDKTEKSIKPKFAELTWKEKDIHVNGNEPVFKLKKPNTQKPSLEFSRDYKIKKEKISIANTDWQEIKPEKIEKCDFTLVVPSVKKINQEYKIEISDKTEKSIKPKFAELTWKEKDVHVKGTELIFDYIKPDLPSFEIERPDLDLKNFKCKTVGANVTTINDCFDFEFAKRKVSLPLVNTDKSVNMPDISNLSNTKVNIIKFPFDNFNFSPMQEIKSNSKEFEYLNTEHVWNEMKNLLNITLNTINSDL